MSIASDPILAIFHGPAKQSAISRPLLAAQAVLYTLATASDDTLKFLDVTTRERDTYCEHPVSVSLKTPEHFSNPNTVAAFRPIDSKKQNVSVVYYNTQFLDKSLSSHMEVMAHEARHAMYMWDEERKPKVEKEPGIGLKIAAYTILSPLFLVGKQINNWVWYSEECKCHEFGYKFDPHVGMVNYPPELLKKTLRQSFDEKFVRGYPCAETTLGIEQKVADDLRGRPHPLYKDDYIPFMMDQLDVFLSLHTTRNTIPKPA